MTFEWKFAGGVDTVTWGLANDAGTDIDKMLVSLDVLNANVVQPGLVPGSIQRSCEWNSHWWLVLWSGQLHTL